MSLNRSSRSQTDLHHSTYLSQTQPMLATSTLPYTFIQLISLLTLTSTIVLSGCIEPTSKLHSSQDAKRIERVKDRTQISLSKTKPPQLTSVRVRSAQELRTLAQAVQPLDRFAELGARAQLERWHRAHTLRVGPIPDYAPVARVYTHQQLAALAPTSALTIAEKLEGLFEVEDYNPSEAGHTEVFSEDTMLLWLRDYHPIYVRSKSGDLTAVHYLAYNPNRARYAIKQDLSERSPAQVTETTTDQEKKLAQRLAIKPSRRSVDARRALPLIHENGNLIIAGPWVFISERVLEDNKQLESEDHLIEGGYMPRGRNGVLSELAKALDISRERIVILPKLPHEATGHVDLYLMALNDHQVIIPKILYKVTTLSAEAQIEQQITRDVSVFLDERAAQLATLGLEVIRLPMLPPLYLPALDEPEGEFDVVFYSPTNGLLVNAGESQTVLLPHFNADRIRPDMSNLSEKYERYWLKAFTALGWQPSFIETTTLGRYLGLIHCVTAATPKLPLRDEWWAQKSQ